MVKLSLLGIPHDEYSSSLRGPAEAPPLIRRELVSDAYSIWSETGIDLGAAGTLVDHGDVHFDGASDPWDLIERISMDIDGLDPAYAPGVSHREPGGLSTRQVINLIHTLDQPIVAADIVEYNPRCDVSNMDRAAQK